MLLIDPHRCMNIAGVAFLAFTLVSCLNPNKINKWVAYHYQPGTTEPAKRKNEQIVIASKLPVMGLHPSETEKKWSQVLPLIVYWHFDYRNTCTLNPQIAVNNIISAISTYGGNRLKGKMNGRHLELSIEQIPNVFLLDDKGWLVFPGFGAETLSIQPTVMDMIVSYRLFDTNNLEVKRGTISIGDPDKAVGLKMFHSLKKMTWEYLDHYDENITAMSRRLIDRLAAEL
jgi:hypothetical protein